MEPRQKKLLIVAIKVVLTAAIFVWFFLYSPITAAALLEELRAIEGARFVPWLALAVAIKLVGIFANIRRWQLLLRGQELWLDFRFLAGSFFIGRFFGIVTPGTLGLDGFKLYDSIRVSRKPVECAAVIAIDKVIGLVSLSAALLLVFPMGWDKLPGLNGQSAALIGVTMAVATAGFFTVLLAPRLTRPLLELVPTQRLHAFAQKVFDAATAYAGHRGVLVRAVGLALVGHVTTALMYWGILNGIAPGAPDPSVIVLSALLMTSATLVGPTVGGEGIREFVFVKLLAGLVPDARSFLFGHIGFWIEKGLLGLPGGVIYALRKGEYEGPVTRVDLDRLQAELAQTP